MILIRLSHQPSGFRAPAGMGSKIGERLDKQSPRPGDKFNDSLATNGNEPERLGHRIEEAHTRKICMENCIKINYNFFSLAAIVVGVVFYRFGAILEFFFL